MVVEFQTAFDGMVGAPGRHGSPDFPYLQSLPQILADLEPM